MYFEQFYLACLSHASYMLGSDGIAAVVDPQRDVGIYLDEAQKNNLAIRYVIETHLHADFVSGHRELAALTGARIYLGAKAGAKFAHIPVREGDEIGFGRCRLKFLETPGHTPESIAVLVTDVDRSPDPFAVLTGDTLFIGDVGRPDLSPEHTPRQLAGLLYDSLQKLLRLPDDVEVYPAHGAGSLCGKQLSAERKSTIGIQRAINYALRPATRDEFVSLLTADLPERPGYFAFDVEINRAGASPLGQLAPIRALRPGEALGLQESGAVVLDTRPAAQFGGAHVPGAVNIGLSGQFASWAGRLIGLDKDIVIVAEDHEHIEESRTRLARVGIERVAGYLEDGMANWVREGLPVGQIPQISVQDVHDMLNADPREFQLIDVRQPGEWAEGHIEHAVLKPLPNLTASLDDLDRGRRAIVHCKGGYRSSAATSLLARAGFEELVNLTGGFDAWRACGLPYLTGERTAVGG